MRFWKNTHADQHSLEIGFMSFIDFITNYSKSSEFLDQSLNPPSLLSLQSLCVSVLSTQNTTFFSPLTLNQKRKMIFVLSTLFDTVMDQKKGQKNAEHQFLTKKLKTIAIVLKGNFLASIYENAQKETALFIAFLSKNLQQALPFFYEARETEALLEKLNRFYQNKLKICSCSLDLKDARTEWLRNITTSKIAYFITVFFPDEGSRVPRQYTGFFGNHYHNFLKKWCSFFELTKSIESGESSEKTKKLLDQWCYKLRKFCMEGHLGVLDAVLPVLIRVNELQKSSEEEIRAPFIILKPSFLYFILEDFSLIFLQKIIEIISKFPYESDRFFSYMELLNALTIFKPYLTEDMLNLLFQEIKKIRLNPSSSLYLDIKLFKMSCLFSWRKEVDQMIFNFAENLLWKIKDLPSGNDFFTKILQTIFEMPLCGEFFQSTFFKNVSLSVLENKPFLELDKASAAACQYLFTIGCEKLQQRDRFFNGESIAQLIDNLCNLPLTTEMKYQFFNLLQNLVHKENIDKMTAYYISFIKLNLADSPDLIVEIFNQSLSLKIKQRELLFNALTKQLLPFSSFYTERLFNMGKDLIQEYPSEEVQEKISLFKSLSALCISESSELVEKFYALGKEMATFFHSTNMKFTILMITCTPFLKPSRKI